MSSFDFKKLPFRQVHLDFHTAPQIPAVGSRFDKKEWQQTLLDARVNSITLFAKCHHGWSYHPTKVGQMHPQLGFDLLRAQYEACREIGVKTPIYLSAGLDNVASHEHPAASPAAPAPSPTPVFTSCVFIAPTSITSANKRRKSPDSTRTARGFSTTSSGRASAATAGASK